MQRAWLQASYLLELNCPHRQELVVAMQMQLWWLVMMDEPLRAAYPRFTKMVEDVFSHPLTLKAFQVRGRWGRSEPLCLGCRDWRTGAQQPPSPESFLAAGFLTRHTYACLLVLVLNHHSQGADKTAPAQHTSEGSVASDPKKLTNPILPYTE
eukprot:scaffold169243_cov20-Tisochrysis_lutea.AAC.1